MKKIVFKRLDIEHWRGMTLSVSFGDDKTIIRGTNGTGKSHIADAIHWLIEGVDAQNRTNFNLYDDRLPLVYENAIPAIAELTLSIDDTEYAIKRSAKPKWERKRGNAEYTKAPNDEYLFYIDSLAVSAKKYWEFIEDMFAPKDKLKIMLNVRHYQSLDWKELRKHFADMVGIISEDELKGDYSSIAALLDKYKSIDAVKGKLMQEIIPIKNDLARIESEISGMESMLPDISGVENAKLIVASINAQIAEIDKEIAGLGDSNKPYVEKRKKEEDAINEKNDELRRKRTEWELEQNAPIASISEQINNIESQNSKINAENAMLARNRGNLENQIRVAEEQAKFLDEEVKRLRAENADIKNRQFDSNMTCPSCGQPLPENEIERLRTEFYEKKERDHLTKVAQGTEMVERYRKQLAYVESYQKQLEELSEPKPLLSSVELQKQLDDAKTKYVPFIHSDEYKRLSAEIDDMKANLTVVPELDYTELKERKASLQSKLKDNYAIIALKDEREKGYRRIESKRMEKFTNGKKLAELEGLLFKCTEREREWASIVRDRANRFMHYCSVEMIDFQKDGTAKDVCLISIDGVDTNVANTARQLVAGIDIAEAFQANAELNLPIIIDNAEQIADSNIPQVNNQIILTYVDEKEPELVIE